jgi:hypothetical protein
MLCLKSLASFGRNIMVRTPDPTISGEIVA